MKTYIVDIPKPPFTLMQDGRPPLPCWRPKWRTNLDRYSFESVKLGRTVEVVYEWEFKHCMILECDPFVRCYCEYPLEITAKDLEGKTANSKLDALVRFINNVEQIREVKSLKQAHKSTRQYEIQCFWCNKAPIEHRLILSEIHLTETLVKNCIAIFPYLSKTRRDDIRAHVMTIIDRDGRCRLETLRTDNPVTTDRLYAAALQLLCDGTLTAPLSEQEWSRLELTRRTNPPDMPLCEGTTTFPEGD